MDHQCRGNCGGINRLRIALNGRFICENPNRRTRAEHEEQPDFKAFEELHQLGSLYAGENANVNVSGKWVVYF